MFCAIDQPENTVRCLTPAGPGAVAVLQLELATPERAAHALAGFKRSTPAEPTAPVHPAPVHPAPVNRILFGQWRGEDVLLMRTAPSRWELHCHGGTAAIRRILEDLTAAGVSEAAPGVALIADHAVPAGDGRVDDRVSVQQLVQTAVQRALASCRTRQAADWILRQLDGRLVAPITQLRTGNPASRSAARTQLLQYASFVDLLLRPARVGLFGPPNAGKSSLLNALCGLSRAIVSPVAGTTRDPVEAETQVDGRILRITDTAGLHDQPESLLEADGIQRTRALVTLCDAACVLAPADQPLPDIKQLAAPFSDCRTRILIRSRSDLCPENLRRAAQTAAGQTAVGQTAPTRSVNQHFSREVFVSTVTGEGLEELRRVLRETIFPATPDPSAALPLPGLPGLTDE